MSLERVRARVREAGGEELVERLEHLDQVVRAGPIEDRALASPDADASTDFDVVIAGGGLSLLYAPILARAGLRVAVFDRSQVGSAHREWNASRTELDALVRSGITSAAELDGELIAARYRFGTCRWHGGGEYPVEDVLDCAIDAGKLLALARRKALAEGVQIFDRASLAGLGPGERSVRLELEQGGVSRTLTARVVVDARGAASPHARADLLCPTVGGTLGELSHGDGPDQVRADVGEILVTTEGIEEGKQHLWELFPSSAQRATVYLFHYVERSRAVGSLLSLYARFFDRLGAFKRGDAKLLRPTFGYIPGWSRLGPAPRSPHPRVVLVGDAAARHSPLTFCGFGATLRSLDPASRRIIARVSGGGSRGDGEVVDDRALHTATGALALMLARPTRDPTRRQELNQLLDAAFGSIHAMGQPAYQALLRDELPLRSFVEFLHRTSKLRPAVYRAVYDSLGPAAALRWAAALLTRWSGGDALKLATAR